MPLACRTERTHPIFANTTTKTAGRGWLAAGCLLACLAAVGNAWAQGVDRVTFTDHGKSRQVEGRVVVEAQDGGLLLLGRDGYLWNIEPKDLAQRTREEARFIPFTSEEMATRLLAELPKGFDSFRTAHYLICFNTTRDYAQWCGALLEQLHSGFFNYWTRRGFALAQSEGPLVAIVFADKRDYAALAQAEVGEAAGSIIGYYSLRSNHMMMYDLTGIEAIARLRAKHGGPSSVAQVLAQPEAERTVATIVHEATHQIAFNCGLQNRFSDCPLWFSEGIAMYFETCNLRNSSGRLTIGAVNRTRLGSLQQFLARRPPDSLTTLLADDKRLRDVKQSSDAYAEAWGLTYFLIHQRPKQLLEYMKLLAQKKPLVWDTPQERVEQFTAVFGDLKKLDAELVRYLGRVQ